MSDNIVFKDNSTIVLDALHRATKEAAEKMAVVARDAVQYQILYGYKDRHGKDGHTEIVDTGRLFDSIEGKAVRVSQNAYDVQVGTNVPYAVYVHEGTRKLKARRFIRDGLMNATDKLKQTAIDCMKNA